MKTDKKITEQMKHAIATYVGPVTRCPTGRARAPSVATVVMNASVEWLKCHRGNRPIRDPKAERKRMRMARAERERIAKRNAAVRNGINERGDAP
jgi:hypothetical protein